MRTFHNSYPLEDYQLYASASSTKRQANDGVAFLVRKSLLDDYKVDVAHTTTRISTLRLRSRHGRAINVVGAYIPTYNKSISKEVNATQQVYDELQATIDDLHAGRLIVLGDFNARADSDALFDAFLDNNALKSVMQHVRRRHTQVPGRGAPTYATSQTQSSTTTS
jgi:exonuclease III